MKPTFFKIALCVLLIANFSCDKETSEAEFNEQLSPSMAAFKANFPNEFAQLDLDRSQVIKDANNALLATSSPVISNNQVRGRLFQYADGITLYYDLSRYSEFVTTFDVFDKSSQTYAMKFDAKSQSYQPDFTTAGSFWCKAACTLGAMAIAASDGPAPLMDALAITYGAACLADCVINEK